MATTTAPIATEPPENPTSRLQFMVRALRYRNYRLFFTGQLISLLGSWMTTVATQWLVYHLTNSALMIAAVTFAGQIPAFLLGPFAGVMIDRWNRHRLLVVTQTLAMLQSFGLAILTFSGHIEIKYVIVLMAFQGFINAFDLPGRQTFVIELIEDKADLSNAIALNSSMFNMARLIGPAVGGVIIYFTGEAWCFLLDGFSYVAVITGLLMMRVPAYKRPATDKNPVHELREGFRYAFRFPPIRALLLLMAFMSLVGMPYGVVLPVVAAKTLNGSALTFGLLTAAAGLGALTSALVLAARKSILGLARLIPTCTLGFGVAMLLFAQARTVWLAVPLLYVAGFCMMQQNAAANTILQTIVEPDKRGRVMSLYTTAFMGMMPLGSLWAGKLADYVGARTNPASGTTWTLSICAVGSLISGFVFLRSLPGLREYIRPIYQNLGILPETAAAVEITSELAAPPERAG